MTRFISSTSRRLTSTPPNADLATATWAIAFSKISRVKSFSGVWAIVCSKRSIDNLRLALAFSSCSALVFSEVSSDLAEISGVSFATSGLISGVASCLLSSFLSALTWGVSTARSWSKTLVKRATKASTSSWLTFELARVCSALTSSSLARTKRSVFAVSLTWSWSFNCTTSWLATAVSTFIELVGFSLSCDASGLVSWVKASTWGCSTGVTLSALTTRAPKNISAATATEAAPKLYLRIEKRNTFSRFWRSIRLMDDFLSILLSPFFKISLPKIHMIYIHRQGYPTMIVYFFVGICKSFLA